MQLESARAELRLRKPAEAMDLGVLLLRSLATPALRAWLGVILPMQLVVLLLCVQVHLAWALVAWVWLAPLVDRVWLILLGDGLFGPPPGVRALWHQLFGRGRRGLWGDLLWRRPDVARRAIYLPVPLLEGLSGAAAQQRRRVLAATHGGVVWVLWTGCLLLELASVAGLVALGWMLLPEEAHWTPGMTLGMDSETFFWRGLTLAFLLAHGLVQALFVAAGFGLYLNGRTWVEGWDVELVFRRMARRLAALTGASALIVCLSAAAGAAAQADVPQPSEPAVEAPHDSVGESLDEQAASEQAVERDAGAEGSDAEVPHTHSALQPEYRRPLPELADDEVAARALARVRERPELQRTRFEERWVLRDFGADEDDPPFELPPFLLGWVEAMAVAFEYTLWAAVVLALGAFVYFVIAQLRRPGGKVSRDDASMDQAARVHVAGAPAREISAVEALGRARALCEAGRTAEALGMLYVGMIAGFTVASGLRVPAEATEAQCLRLVESGQVGQARRALFGELVERRLWVVYGHAAIQPPEIEAFCARYAAVFEVGR